MACPKNLRCLDLFLLFAPSRLRVKDCSWDCIAEISRKGAKTLRFGKEVAGLVDILTSLPCFNFSVLFAPSRLRVKDCFVSMLVGLMLRLTAFLKHRKIMGKVQVKVDV